MKKIIIILGLVTLALAGTCDDVVLDLKINKTNVRLSSIIENIAKDCEYSIFFENGSREFENKRVGLIALKEKTPDEILDFLLSRYNFNYTLENDVLTISKYKTKTFKVDFLDSPRTSNSNVNVAVGGSGGVASVSGGNTGANIAVKETFDFWKGLEENIKGILDDKEKNIVINKKAGFVTIRGDYSQLKQVEAYIEKLLTTLKKQVIVDVKVMSVTLDNSNKVGIDWTQLSGGFINSGVSSTATTTGTAQTVSGITNEAALIPGTNSWTVSQNSFNVNIFLDFLRSYGETKALSNPKIMAMNNQPSLISVGDNVNYGITTSVVNNGTTSESFKLKELFIGVLLDITPQIDDNGYVTLKINPSISDFRFAEDATSKENRILPPDTVSRRISTVARVKDGGVIILGGLISNTKGKTQNKVWLLGDIPFLGWLFKSEDITDITTEIVFVLTPRIVSDEKQPTLKELGFKLGGKEEK